MKHIQILIIGTFLGLLNISISKAQAENTNEFGGLDWGAAVSLTWDLGKNDRIKSAQLVNNIVRITDQENARARIMLEAHYFFTPTGKFMGNKNTSQGREWGFGPFVALQPGSDEIIDSIAAGIMVGLKRNNDSNDNSSFNFGIGLVVDPNVQILGDGVIPNQALPLGENEIRFQEREQLGILFIFSTSF